MDDRNSESSLGTSERVSYLLHEMTQSRLWTDPEGWASASGSKEGSKGRGKRAALI